MNAALAVFAKTAGLSPVKTRLARGIGMAAALHFHQLATRATAEVVTACGDCIRPYWALAEDQPSARARRSEFPVITQGAGALGDRMYRVHRELQARHGAAVMIGTDIPQISADLLADAVNTLSQPDVDHILGPAKDGGFWLFGSKHPVSRRSWNRVPYSTNHTAETLRSELADSGYLAILPTLTDIDTAADLDDLREALSRLPAATCAQRELLDWLNTLPGK